MFLRLLLNLLILASPALAQTATASARAECLVPVVLAPGAQRAEISLPIDACDSVLVTTAFPTDRVQVQFVKPDGIVLPWARTTAGLTFELSSPPPEQDGAPAQFVYQAQLNAPTPGFWKVVIQWPEAQWAGAGSVVYALFLGSRYELAVLVPGTAFPKGSPFSATLALMENRKPRLDATATTANLFKDGVRVGPVTFAMQSFPDLQAQSLLADLTLADPGHYVLSVECTGTGTSGPFRRTAFTDFDVYLPQGKVLGTFKSTVK